MVMMKARVAKHTVEPQTKALQEDIYIAAAITMDLSESTFLYLIKKQQKREHVSYCSFS